MFNAQIYSSIYKYNNNKYLLIITIRIEFGSDCSRILQASYVAKLKNNTCTPI